MFGRNVQVYLTMLFIINKLGSTRLVEHILDEYMLV